MVYDQGCASESMVRVQCRETQNPRYYCEFYMYGAQEWKWVRQGMYFCSVWVGGEVMV